MCISSVEHYTNKSWLTVGCDKRKRLKKGKKKFKHVFKTVKICLTKKFLPSHSMMNNSHHFNGSLLIDLFAQHSSFQISILLHNVHRSITVKMFSGSLFRENVFSYFLQSITDFSRGFSGCKRVHENWEDEGDWEKGKEKGRGKSSSIIMEFCYLNIFFVANPTRKYKTRERISRPRSRNKNKIREWNV